MDTSSGVAEDRQVTAADIARLAGVSRAAVSNWRRRHEDFPGPVAGSASSPLFSYEQVMAWLDGQGKGGEASDEVRLWNELRNHYPESIVQGIADVADLLSGVDGARVPSELVLATAAKSSARELVDGLTERLASSGQRTGSDASTKPVPARAIARLAGSDAQTVFDPACGTGTLLAVAGAAGAVRTGQDIDPDAARLTRARLALETGTETSASEVDIRVGDALRADKWPGHLVELVVCDPPVPSADWGREELLLDPRWAAAVPPRAEGELAWLLHAYAHTAPGGHAVVVMSASAAYRRTGRRVRADLVRRGLITDVVALPGGMAAGHSQPVHVWVLRKPAPDASPAVPPAERVRMADLGGVPIDRFPEAIDPGSGVGNTAEVPLLDLLDDMVDLTPAHHTSVAADYVKDYAEARAALRQAATGLLRALPPLADGPGDLRDGRLRLSELADAGLISIEGARVNSRSDQLDGDFLNGFVHSPANANRSTSSSGTFRTDARSARVPQMDIERQRQYGEAFRAIERFQQDAKLVSEWADKAARLAREGLGNGALEPGAEQDDA